ncbi:MULTISPECIES: Ni/Fe hydrogenase subunit alpha [unclassified Oleiphilus]|jgi:NAD-reducing hydrogenase large subunit|uniref:Ni/Fe hydrogenase subunit alpha n=2 Tax=Oleiphilus TaxID=141450 RepID=UPI0007C307CC|nr:MULTISPECIES: Ni/Fe hydrogenase subunit alpha [unclassified Oleiphilus]KZY80403.1 NADP oxidoreductase [Oleiphilus sp. HI0069]KZY39806.1 NADP oxidoreductase [Oleiphilus sp. HI0043]KZY60475.1 NADP oxidoreductase [Oleiphilus sp. HI0061]KZZ67764.1 NADP oxidoreductase [Oleiphilus sp. HI0128]KZZ78500.1 NADP oxidoreductase [Oleiphilus sp. HI0132]
MKKTKARIVEIEPLTRVEGHGKVTIHLDEQNQVSEARLHIVEFRGFERFIQGRLLWEVPVIVQRLCGICPVSHHLAAAKAMDMIVGVDQLTPTAEKMRRLMHYGQIMQSNVLHFFHLSSPDLLFGFSAPAKKRNIFEVIKAFPDLAKKGVLMRKYGQEVIQYTAGKKIHGNTAIPGGISKSLSVQERDKLLQDIDQMIEWSQEAVDITRNYTLEHLGLVESFANFKSSHMSLVRDDGALDLYDGQLRAIDANGNLIFDQMDYRHFDDFIKEEVKPWSYMKFPFIKSRGNVDGWYRVGPLARMNTVSFIDTPLANARHEEFKEFSQHKPAHMSLAYHWARMIEVLHCVEKIKELLLDPDIMGTDLKLTGDRREEGIAVIEAPRGSLFHHYKVNENDQVTYCNLIVSTTHNNTAMNKAVTDVARKYISGKNKISEGMLNHIEVAVRAYDPCLSCATHALGQMPLKVELFDHENKLIDSNSQFVDGQH